MNAQIKKSGNEEKIPLGVLNFKDSVALIYRTEYSGGKKTEPSLHITTSVDGMNFAGKKHPISISKGFLKEKISDLRNIVVTPITGGYFMSYVYSGKRPTLKTAFSKNLKEWAALGKLTSHAETGVLVPDLRYKGSFIMYSGESSIKVSYSKSLKTWKTVETPVLKPRVNNFDDKALHVMGVTLIKDGILVIYDTSHMRDGLPCVQVGAALFSSVDPTKLIWRSDIPLFEECPDEHKEAIRPLRALFKDNRTILYFVCGKSHLLTVSVQTPHAPLELYKKKSLKLERHIENPIIAPNPENAWEGESTFNPAAYYDGNKVHLLYRAIGADGVSRLGYTSSPDGFSFDERSGSPVYTAKSPRNKTGDMRFDPVKYPSGGSWGGCEDARLVKIENKFYLTFSLFDGWDYIRIGLVSISEEDFMNQNWKWSEPTVLSVPGKITKNWVIFPEKIKGKFAVLHGFKSGTRNEAMIEYVDDIEKTDSFIKSDDKFRHEIEPNTWDSAVRGAGPPPLRTDKGWLVLYHAMDRRDPNRYKLGALLLDLEDPTKVLHRSSAPMLEPDVWYENESKAGVVYCCGAIIKDNSLFIYYGGGDKYSCVATAPLNEFLTDLTSDRALSFKLTKASIA